MMRDGRVVLNSDTKMQFGVTRCRKRTDGVIGSWRGVCLLDPVSLEEDYKSWTKGVKGWVAVPSDHLLQKWVSFFEIVDNADWYTNCEGEFDEHYIENPHEVFKQIRKLFGF